MLIPLERSFRKVGLSFADNWKIFNLNIGGIKSNNFTKDKLDWLHCGGLEA